MKKIIKITISLLIFSFFYLPKIKAEENITHPLHIYEDKYEEVKREMKNLQDNYGKDNFYDSLQCKIEEKRNPFAFLRCLRETKYFLEKKDAPKISCPKEYNYSSGICVPINDGCMEEFGIHSVYDKKDETSGEYTCKCAEGFSWNNNQSECIQSSCPKDMIFYSPYRDKYGDILYGRCLDFNNACQIDYPHSIFNSYNEFGQILCSCEDGYEWKKNKCVKKILVKGIEGPSSEEIKYLETIEKERKLIKKKNTTLSERLSGLILLEVEENGEAWYFNPEDHKRYFLSTPQKAFEIMKNFGLGVQHKIIEENKTYPQKLLGKIIIDVEKNGEAYYIYPLDKKAYYLGRPTDAFKIMRELGLGISNKNIHQLDIQN